MAQQNKKGEYLPQETKTWEMKMKLGNPWHGNVRQERRGVNKPVLLLIAALGGFWATVAFLVFG